MKTDKNSPEIIVREISENKAYLEFRNTPTYLINSLRRILLSEIPKVAFTRVMFEENNTAFFEEYIAHRIGLIPLKTDVRYYFDSDGNLKDLKKLKDEKYYYEIHVSNTGDDAIMLMSSDIRPLKKEYPEIVIKDIPLIPLGPGQSLIARITANVGIGKEHARHQAVIAPAFKPYPMVRNEGCRYPKDCPDAPCVDVCPQSIFRIDKRNKKVVVKDVEKCKMCRDCVEVCPFGIVDVLWDETHYLLKYETDGSISPLDALWAAVHIWRTKIRELKKKILEVVKE
ncbi:MAG: DNA-directed RNA polymerase subunit D [Euryarchaeota archaeon]|nr:DNA-directed RNA polymerase subunit D [Euryarchaeota archaeon]MCD6158994.1 DNA-directed RNA polymerase subunit D [Euryarchaeota archaeon]